ncbi:MAG: peptidase U32 family protein [Bacteroidota bacterium]|nr:peptidase U32 family protein [Bacteroidota bacterium]
MKKREDFELLAPAGSYESLTAAGQGGADAIYFGIEQLNMRARSSSNFTAEDLPQIVSRTRELGMKAYLTVNTVVYNQELILMRKIIDLAVKHDIDAIIASDQSVLQYCKSAGARVHLSTQLNISNIETLKFYSNFADVAVLARELNLEQVREMAGAIEEEEITGPSGHRIQLEMFVHGALCMAISGKCYLSLHEHNQSANRGACYQVCRRGYTVTDKDREVELDIDNEYIMSPKDLKTIHFLNKILDAGVSILKIEGRARSAEYVKTVISCYDEAIHAYVEGSFTREKIETWDKRLATVFNRGFWDGYYLGQRLGEWSEKYGSRSTLKKVYTGKVSNYFDRIGVAEVLIETGELNVGDTIVFIGQTTGAIEMKVKELRVDEINCETASKGDRCSLPVEEAVRRSDKVYRLVSRS